MLREYTDYQQRRIERDISSFADPGTSVEVSGSGRRFRATWTMRGVSREAMFSVSLDHGISVKASGQSRRYDAFLAGEEMANLRNVAEMIKQTARRRIFVPTKARRTDDSQTRQVAARPATDCLVDLVEEADGDSTRVIMVTGEAGAGKTQILQEIVRQQADSYLRGKTNKLFLYVNAQGRALARLNEALATELQDLRVSLTYHSVATLTRVGILIPIIDGFDELLGVSGYDDAFNSLAQFLEQLEGRGCLVASARSVYYEEEFLSRAGRQSATGEQAWFHVPVAIADWGDEERGEFLDIIAEQRGLDEEDRAGLETRVYRVFESQKGLASKPLFFARTTELLVQDGEDLPNSDDLLSALTQAFLAREQREKLLDRQQEPMLTENQIKLLMSELAQEMWNQETRELDLISVREVAEYVLATEDVPESVRQIVTERMPTLAFLKRSDEHAGIAFEHEVFFIFFLSCSIIDQYLLEGIDLRVMLSRSSLPELIAERLAYELTRRGVLSADEGLQSVLGRMAEAGRTEWRRTTQVRENAGLIVLSVLRACADESEEREIHGQTISSVVFPGGHLHDVTLRQCALIGVSMRRTDLSSTRFIECTSRDVLLVEPRVKAGGTVLDIRGLDVGAEVVGIQVLGEETNEMVYAPEGVASILKECGARVEEGADESARDIPRKEFELLERFIRAYGRANPVCEADENLRSIFSHESWSDVRRLLIKHGIVTPEERQTGGNRKQFLRRRFLAEEIMSGASKAGRAHPQIVHFWDEFEAASNAKREGIGGPGMRSQRR